MKTLTAAIVALCLASTATPAWAYVVEVTTSVTLTDAEDRGELRDALQSAVDNVLHQAIAFTPTLIVLTNAVLVGDRLYIRLLLADQDGERTFRDLGPGEEDDAPSASPDLSI